jgi:hypothetical protein
MKAVEDSGRPEFEMSPVNPTVGAVQGWVSGTTSTQIGKACEMLVACSIMLASKGRLTPFLPLADDDGLDLLLLDKLTGKTVPVQVKGRTGVDAAGHATVQFDVRKKTLSTHYGAVLLATLIDVENVSIRQSWLIPMSRLEGLATDKGDVFAIRPSTLEHAKDKCRPFRCDSMAELVRRLSAVLDAPNRLVPDESAVFSSADHRRMLVSHLHQRISSGEVPDRELATRVLALLEGRAGVLPELAWDDSAEFAHLIDGYRLCEEAGLGDPAIFADRKLREADRTDAWEGSALELWVCLFLEHRRWRFAGCKPGDRQIAALNRLCTALCGALAAR